MANACIRISSVAHPMAAPWCRALFFVVHKGIWRRFDRAATSAALTVAWTARPLDTEMARLAGGPWTRIYIYIRSYVCVVLLWWCCVSFVVAVHVLCIRFFLFFCVCVFVLLLFCGTATAQGGAGRFPADESKT